MNFSANRQDGEMRGWLPLEKSSMVRRWLVVGTALLSSTALGLIGSPAVANSSSFNDNGLVQLIDGDSSFLTNIFEFDERQAWLVNDVDYLFSDLYFLNFGKDPAQPEFKLKDLALIDWDQPSANRLTADFFLAEANLNFFLDLSLKSSDQGSTYSTRQDIVTLYNAGDSAIDVTMINYLDLDLNFDGQYDNDSLFFKGNTIIQTDPSGAKASVTMDQDPTSVQFSEYPFLLSQLYDGSRSTLRSTTKSLTNTDGTAAIKFDRSLDPKTSLSFKFTKRIQLQENSADVPEPTTVLAFGTVGGALLLLKRSSR
jgi:hypothetical protein